MRIIKFLTALTLVAMCGVSSMAQTNDCCLESEGDCESISLGYKPYPYGFIQVQGGMGTTFTDISCWKLFTPTVSIAIGDMFTPIVGVRAHANGWFSNGAFDTMGQYYQGITAYDQAEGGWALTGDPMKYRYDYLNCNADLMINVFNIFSKNRHRFFDVYVIGGIGLNYAWHNDKFEQITTDYNVKNDISNAWGYKETPREHLLSHNLRLGLLADFNIAKNWSAGVEIDFNSLDDRFNSKYKDADDWMMTAQASITYKFGFKKPCAPKPVLEPVVVTVPEPEPVVIPEPEPAPAPVVEEPKPVVVKDEPLKETIFYAIRESDPDPEAILNRVVEWCKKYPNKTISVDGYADKGTGNAKLNVGYAKSRADKVAKSLQQKGVDAKRMTVKSYGDSVQPFTDNDRNRCVIIEGK